MADRNSDHPDPSGAPLPDPAPCREVPLAAVDLEDHTFVISPAPDLSRLLSSMREVGLLAPPWLRPKGRRRWQAVAGAKRLWAAAHLGWERILARTLPAGTPDSHCLLLALYDNAFTRGFNLWEQAILAVRLLEHWDRATVAARFLPYLGLPPAPAFLARLEALATLEPPFQELAAGGRLALTAGAVLARWTPEDRAAARPFLEQLWLSQSKQERFLEEVARLARREAVSPGAVLARRAIQQILGEPSLNPQERTAAVRRQLEGWVYPRLSAARQAYQAALGRLGLAGHPRVRLKPPPAFEGPDFHLEIKFRDGPELQELLADIARLTQQEEFSTLTRL
jgi:ParB-like chromosome segregation protein Spo0J